MARPGFVHEVDERTPPLVVSAGDVLRAERLPLGSRVVYAPEPLAPVPDLREAIAAALAAPLDSAPLRQRLQPGMRLTVAFDDLTTPSPPMRQPDVRGWIVEGVLAVAAEAGVDDVTLVCARGLRRRLTDSELHGLLGERVFRSFFADGRLVQHDAEETDGLVTLGGGPDGVGVQINRRAAESDLVVMVHAADDPADVGWATVAAGLGSPSTVGHLGPHGTAAEDQTAALR
ncbi:MAG: lactate racemase domain-containing protein, partial [Actinomycetes bacterium]